MYGPDTFYKLLFVNRNGLHACIRLAMGSYRMHARSLDEIRTSIPQQIIGLALQAASSESRLLDVGLTSFVITLRSFANVMLGSEFLLG